MSSKLVDQAVREMAHTMQKRLTKAFKRLQEGGKHFVVLIPRKPFIDLLKRAKDETP